MTRSDLENLIEGIGLDGGTVVPSLEVSLCTRPSGLSPGFLIFFMSYNKILTTRITFREKIEEERRKRNSTRLEAQQCVVSAFLQNWRE